MRRFVILALAIGIVLTGCASNGQQESVGPVGRVKQAWQSMLHPTIRDLARYFVCGLEVTVSGLVIRLSPVGAAELQCTTLRRIPAERLIAEPFEGLGVGAIVELERIPGPAGFSAENASAAPRIRDVGDAFRVKTKAPR